MSWTNRIVVGICVVIMLPIVVSPIFLIDPLMSTFGITKDELGKILLVAVGILAWQKIERIDENLKRITADEKKVAAK